MNTEKCEFYFYFVGNWLDLWKRVTKFNGLVERGCSACYLLLLIHVLQYQMCVKKKLLILYLYLIDEINVTKIYFFYMILN